MGKTVQVTCDGCGADITTRSNSVDYRLVLDAESKPGHGSGFYTDMMIYPPVDPGALLLRPTVSRPVA